MLDERGYAVSHKQRVRRSIQLASRTDIDIQWGGVQLVGFGRGGAVTLNTERIQSDGIACVLKRLNAGGWYPQEDGSVAATYGHHRVFVWEDSEAWPWAYAVATRDGDPVDASYAETFDDAKRACAAWLSKG